MNYERKVGRNTIQHFVRHASSLANLLPSQHSLIYYNSVGLIIEMIGHDLESQVPISMS